MTEKSDWQKEAEENQRAWNAWLGDALDNPKPLFGLDRSAGAVRFDRKCVRPSLWTRLRYAWTQAAHALKWGPP